MVASDAMNKLAPYVNTIGDRSQERVAGIAFTFCFNLVALRDLRRSFLS